MADKPDNEVIDPEIVSDADWERTAAKLEKNAEPEPSEQTAGKTFTLLHPMSGVLVIALDYLCFGAELPLVTIPLVCLFAFLGSGFGVYIIQRNLAGNSRTKSLLKALICGIITAFPTPVFGTVLGSLVLAVSGLQWFERSFGKMNKPK